MRIRTFDFVLV